MKRGVLMKNFLLKKWMAPIILLICLIVILNSYLSNLSKIVSLGDQLGDDFFPITFHQGEITYPVNTVIEKNVTLDGETIKVLVDTRTNAVASSITAPGIYLGKKCLSIYDGKTTSSECFQNEPKKPFTIQKNDFQQASNILKNISPFLVGISIFGLVYFIVLFYTLITHLIVNMLSATTFSQTLYVNTLAYSAFWVIERVASFDLGFLIKLGLFILINYLILKKKDK